MLFDEMVHGIRGGTPGGARRHAAALAAATVGLILMSPAAARAQAVCTAPHSTPTLPTSGVRATEAPGSGWIQLTFYHEAATDQFDIGGARVALFGGGRATTTSLFASGAVGLIDGSDLLVQVPIHRLHVTGPITGERERTGIGDVRLHLRIGPRLFGRDGLALALRAGVKLPGSRFPVDPGTLPLTEGQRDWEIVLQLGRVARSAPVYVQGWIGYRWREEDADRGYDPGDERMAYLAVGTELLGLRWELAVDGLWGRTPRSQGLALETERRALLQFYPRVGLPIGAGELLIGGRVPAAGRNLPASPALTAGYFLGWGRR